LASGCRALGSGAGISGGQAGSVDRQSAGPRSQPPATSAIAGASSALIVNHGCASPAASVERRFASRRHSAATCAMATERAGRAIGRRRTGNARACGEVQTPPRRRYSTKARPATKPAAQERSSRRNASAPR
jgi:hypothetical protein